jgi:hypothetical protein
MSASTQDQFEALDARIDLINDLSATELAFLDGVTAGTATASKALVLGASKEIATITSATITTLTAPNIAGTSDFANPIKVDGVTMSPQKWVDVTVTAALLDSAGAVAVIAGGSGDQYKIRDIRLVGGGTNFAAGGNRLISLTDGTTVWTTIANADIEAAPAATLAWGDTKVPFLTGTSDTASVAASTIRFQYSGGTTDHSATGSIKFSVMLEKVA